VGAVDGDIAGASGASVALLGPRFVVELGAYASFGYWGAAGPGPVAGRTLSAVVAPLVAVVVWLLLLAPKARWPLGEPAAVILELSIFALAAVALAWSGPVVLAVVFGVVAAGNALLLRRAGLRRLGSGADMSGEPAR
jgi:hypothetical protein